MTEVEKLIKQIKTFFPEVKVFEQPKTAQGKMLFFENKYQMRTEDFLKKRCPQVSEEDKDAWINAYETYCSFSKVIPN